MTDTALSLSASSLEGVPIGRAGPLFFREFVRSPLRTASIMPSSRALAERMTAPVHRSGKMRPVGRVVVELGPGTGAFTSVLQEWIRPGDRHLAIELNPTMAAHLARAHPTVEVVTARADDLARILSDHGVGGADLIVSGLPWQAFAGEVGGRLIGTVAGALTPGGSYTQFTYTWTKWAPPARRQLRQLHAAFEHVDISSTVWRNLPPAFVYTARQPRRTSSHTRSAAPRSVRSAGSQ